MYKFRTLVPNADGILGAEMCRPLHGLTTPVGKILRETRLDELPQLINVLKGDMDFLGPRPERPEMYDKVCRFISGYDIRFEVMPGLLGFSQIFTPHSSPKRIRTFVDNRLVRKKQRIFWDIFEVFLTGLIVLRTAVIRLSRAFYRGLVLRRILRTFSEKRRLERETTRQSSVRFRVVEDPKRFIEKAELVDINEMAFLIRSDRAMDFPAIKQDDAPPSSGVPQAGGEIFQLSVEFKGRRGQMRRKCAYCRGHLFRAKRASDGRFEYVINYTPVSPLNFYLVHQYFLRESLAPFSR